MNDLDALPNSPTLMNAGTDITSYSACFVLPVEDSIDSIYKYYKDAALISKSGGGIGANFSYIRAEGSPVGSTGGVASGPLSFMRVQDTSTDTIKQGGRRRGANMAILDCDHPDIWKFVGAKDTKGELENFNLSVRISDDFMGEVESGTPDMNAPKLWNELCKRAWSSAEPGVLFGDTIDRANTVKHLGSLKITNPCGEQPLLPYESCSLIAINLSNHIGVFVTRINRDLQEVFPKLGVDWDKLKDTTESAVLFMNRVLDKSIFPIPECQNAMELTRKIGVGIMGLHDLLIQLKIPYDSDEGRDLAGEVMQFIYDTADDFSYNLGIQEGNYNGYNTISPCRRNACLTTIAPTGTLSTISDCSSGCEPYYASSYTRDNMNTTFNMMNKWLKAALDEHNVQTLAELPENVRELFKGALDIHWSDHVKMQAILQNSGVDSSISKTINMPEYSTVQDVKDAYEMAWNLGCKGITVYRNNSRQSQVLSTTDGDMPKSTTEFKGAGYIKKADLPDKLKANRYRVRVKNQKVYIIICENDEGQPMEVFAKFPYEGGGSWSTVCRSISLSMRYGVPLQDIIKQLDKSVAVLNDMPSVLARILKTYLVDKGVWVPKCPECKSDLVFEEGCEKCYNCGFNKCG